MDMKFTTKRELLKHLGKNENDRKLVDRMIIKWRVYKEWGMYVLIEWDIDNVSLIHEVDELKKENKNLKDQLSVVSNPKIDEELYEAKVQWEYYQNLYENEVKDKQNRIRKCFQWIKAKYPKAEWEEFRDWVMWD